MAKISFLQSEYEDKLGVLYLIAYLKSQGHSARLFIERRKWLNEVKAYQPDLLGFSCLTGGHLWVESCAQSIKEDNRWDIPIIVGGSHPTFFPEMINNPYIDFICRGEGEYSVKELLDRMDKGEDLTLVPNIWSKQNGCIVKNDVQCLIEDINSLPRPDRSHYNEFSFLKNNPHKKVITARGCPFSCTYCYNSAFKSMYKNKGKLVRSRTVENVIEEIILLKKTSGWETLEIVDDNFIKDKEWFLRFAEQYRLKINLPYACYGTAKNIDKEVAAALKGSNCKFIGFGIEAGNERIRKEIYKKNISNEEIVRGAEVLHAAGVKFLTFNMVGAPFETIEEMEETIRLNLKIKTDYPRCSIMQPYPRTEIFNYCVEKGLIDNNSEIQSFTYFEKSILKYDRNQITKIVNTEKLFTIFSRWPFMSRFYRRIVSLPFPRIYTLLFYITYGLSIKQRYDLRLRHLVFYWLAMRKAKKILSKKPVN